MADGVQLILVQLHAADHLAVFQGNLDLLQHFHFQLGILVAALGTLGLAIDGALAGIQVGGPARC